MQIFGHAVFGVKLLILAFDPKGAPNGFDVSGVSLIERDADTAFAHSAQIDPSSQRRFHHRRCSGPTSTVIVSKKLRIDFKARSSQALGQTHGLAVDTLRNRLKPFGAMKDRIHRRHHRQQACAVQTLRRGLSRGGYVARGFAS